MLRCGSARPWDTLTVLLFAALLLPATATVTLADTTVIVIRHAERDNGALNLNDTGKSRAKNLLEVLCDADISAIYTSTAIRTKQTASPLSGAIDATLTAVSGADKLNEDYAKELAGMVRGQTNKSVLIVSHSNIIHHIVNELTDAKIPKINSDEYDNLFVIIIPNNAEKGKLIRATYGAQRRPGKGCKN